MYITKPPTKRIIPTVKSRSHTLTVEAGLIILKYLTVLWTQIPSDYYANSGITMPPVPTRHRPLTTCFPAAHSTLGSCHRTVK